jgi:hypothetical protein
MGKRIFWPLVTFAALSMCIHLAHRVARALAKQDRYELLVEFAVIPSNDSALKEWLSNLPGVHGQTVDVQRKPNEIRIRWSMTRDSVGHPPRPDFIKHFSRLGYDGLKRYESPQATQ